MYKVLIVDDEKEIREGLTNIFPWKELGNIEVFTAEDAETAFNIANEHDADLLVTDIKMKGMSGLDLIRKLHEESEYAGKSIVISGYDDFELVKTAMQHGAMDYILKPISMEELKRIVRKAIHRIQEERIDAQNELYLKNQVHMALPRKREELLREWIRAAYSPFMESKAIHRLDDVQLGWLAESQLVLMVVEVDNLQAVDPGKKFSRKKDLILFAVGNVMKETFESELQTMSVNFQDQEGRWVGLIGYDMKSGLAPHQSLAEQLIERINQYVKVDATIGVFFNPLTLKDLHDAYEEICRDLETKVLYGGNRLIHGRYSQDNPDRTEIKLNNVDEVLDMLKYGSDSEIRMSMSDFPDLVRTWSLTQIRDVQQRIFDWLLDLFKKCGSAGWKDRWWEKDLIAIWEEFECHDTLESLQQTATSYLLKLAESSRGDNAQISQITREAEQYIRAHYQDNLSLQIVAQHVHVTPVWLSKLFKKEKQTTFLEFLTEIRMEKAKELLDDVRYRVYQVSSEVGYRDRVHFAKLFKKTVGVTPTEYRSQRGIHED